jgi:hypothetical protein
MRAPLRIFQSNPASSAFLASLLLSLIAWLGSTVNRDGVLYLQAAQAFLDGGFAAAKSVFAWPFFSILIALTSRLTGLGLEASGYLLNALFMAGTCALMTACVHREKPALTWLALLTVLALPGLNEYRNELLREFGCWFFIMLAFWLALKWQARPAWGLALAPQAALLAAALFRPEALTLYAALVAWQMTDSANQHWRGVVMIGALPILGTATLVALLVTNQLVDSRLGSEFSRLSTARFDAKAETLAGALLDYARGNSRAILFFGSLALIPIKLIQKFGLFLVPLAFFFSTRKTYRPSQLERLLLCAIAVHLLVLSVFVTDLQFLAGRYVAPILLFSTPFSAAGLQYMLANRPRLTWLVPAIIVIIALANVVSTGPGKGHFVDAGRWLAENARPEQVYIDSKRTAYYAGWEKLELAERNRRDLVTRAAAEGTHALFVLEVSKKDQPWDPDLERSGLEIVQRFDQRNGDAVIIARPRPPGSR